MFKCESCEVLGNGDKYWLVGMQICRVCFIGQTGRNPADYDRIPTRTLTSLHEYIHRGAELGRFLTKMVENDLGAIVLADSDNEPVVQDIYRYIYNEFPSDSWGSPKQVREWRTRHHKEDAHAKNNT